MSWLSISAYMRNVVSGVRNSCVTAETNAARRSLSANYSLQQHGGGECRHESMRTRRPTANS